MSMGAWTDWHAVVMDAPEEAVSVLREQDQAIERLTAENAAFKAQLAYAASTGDECAIEVEALRKDAERMRGELALIVALQAGDGSTINGPTRDDFGRAFRMAQDIARAAMELSHE